MLKGALGGALGGAVPKALGLDSNQPKPSLAAAATVVRTANSLEKDSRLGFRRNDAPWDPTPTRAPDEGNSLGGGGMGKKVAAAALLGLGGAAMTAMKGGSDDSRFRQSAREQRQQQHQRQQQQHYGSSGVTRADSEVSYRRVFAPLFYIIF